MKTGLRSSLHADSLMIESTHRGGEQKACTEGLELVLHKSQLPIIVKIDHSQSPTLLMLPDPRRRTYPPSYIWFLQSGIYLIKVEKEFLWKCVRVSLFSCNFWEIEPRTITQLGSVDMCSSVVGTWAFCNPSCWTKFQFFCKKKKNIKFWSYPQKCKNSFSLN
jgi:hypothetical protein